MLQRVYEGRDNSFNILASCHYLPSSIITKAITKARKDVCKKKKSVLFQKNTTFPEGSGLPSLYRSREKHAFHDSHDINTNIYFAHIPCFQSSNQSTASGKLIYLMAFFHLHKHFMVLKLKCDTGISENQKCPYTHRSTMYVTVILVSFSFFLLALNRRWNRKGDEGGGAGFKKLLHYHIVKNPKNNFKNIYLSIILWTARAVMISAGYSFVFSHC